MVNWINMVTQLKAVWEVKEKSGLSEPSCLRMVKIDESNICSSEIWKKRIFFRLSIFSSISFHPERMGTIIVSTKRRKPKWFFEKSKYKAVNVSWINHKIGKRKKIVRKMKLCLTSSANPRKRTLMDFPITWVFSEYSAEFLLRTVRVVGGRLNRSESILINKFQMRKKRKLFLKSPSEERIEER